MARQLSLSSQILNIEEHNMSLTKRCKELEKMLTSKCETINKLRLSIEKEKFKSNLFGQLLSQMTDIKVDEIYKETTEGIVIKDCIDSGIPVIVNSLLETKQYTITSKKQKPTGKNFRTINNVELVDEKPEQQEQKIKEIEEKKEELVQEHKLDVSYSEMINNIESQFEEIKKSRIYKKALSNIKIFRTKLFGKLNLEDYIALIKTHNTRLQKLFNEKRYDQKKTLLLISSSLSSLDQRLVSFEGYYNSELEPDDIQRLKICLDIHYEHSKRYIPFSGTYISTKLCNYSLCVSSLEECLKRVLINPYGFSNLVYLPLMQNTDDPFSFYSLEKIDSDGKRCWKMECRLDEICRFTREHVLSYCISLFRKMYYDVFSHNTYREDYKSKASICSQDCEQLLINIGILSKPKVFCNIVRDILRENVIIQPSKLDKFNFKKDDPLVKKAFNTYEDFDNSIFGRLFDSITNEQIIEMKFLI